jgi:hypothetical protein
MVELRIVYRLSARREKSGSDVAGVWRLLCGASGNSEVKKCVQSRFYTMQKFCWESVGDLLGIC